MSEMVRQWILEVEDRKSLRLVALCLIFFSPILGYLWVGFNGGNTLLFEDGMLQSFPFRVFLHNAFENGFSPQWVPFSACGFSLLAEGQNGICFPSTQIIYRIFSAETGWLVEMASSRIIAFTLCGLFLRHLHFSWVSYLFGASVYAFCSGTFGLENVPALMWCHALLPGIFLTSVCFMEKRPYSVIWLTMLISLIFLTGHPVMMIYIGMMLSVFFVFHYMHEGLKAKSVQGIGPRLLVLLGTVFLAIIIASPQLLPMLEEFRFSARTVGAGISLDALQNTLYLQPIWAPLSLFPTPLQWQEWGGMSNTIRFPFYALFLGCIGIFFGAKEPRRNFFIFIGLFSILMALGPYVGLWKLVHSLPVLKYFRFPYRWLFFLPICVAYLSARGVDHLLDKQSGFPPVLLGKIGKFILLMSLPMAGVFFYRYHSRILQLTQQALEYSPLLTGLLWLSTIGMILAAFLSLRKETARHGVLLGVALTVISLFASIAYNIKSPIAIHNLETIGWNGNNRPNEPQTYRTSSGLSPYDVWLTNSMNRHYPYTPNLTVLNGTLTTGHYFSFFPYWSANVSTWCRDALNGDNTKQIYLDLSSAKWLFLQDGSSSTKSAFSATSYKGMNAYVNKDAISRASVVLSHRLFSDETALLAFLESPEFDPRLDLAILSKDAKVWDLRTDLNKAATVAIPPEATILIDRPDHIEIELKSVAPKGAFLVLSDTYYPGWKALADGVEQKIIRANYAFRSIQIPEGAKRIVFSYEPLVPDAALPLPTLLFVALGIATVLRFYLIGRRN